MSATGASRANAAADSERIVAARAKAKAPASELGNFHRQRGESGESGEGDDRGEEGGHRDREHPAPAPSLSSDDRAAVARAKAKKPASELGRPARRDTGDEEGTAVEASGADALKAKPTRPKRERCDYEPLYVCACFQRASACTCVELLTSSVCVSILGVSQG
jgi:hypothetical protein